jgi:hypothetical protein
VTDHTQGYSGAVPYTTEELATRIDELEKSLLARPGLNDKPLMTYMTIILVAIVAITGGVAVLTDNLSEWKDYGETMGIITAAMGISVPLGRGVIAASKKRSE